MSHWQLATESMPSGLTLGSYAVVFGKLLAWKQDKEETKHHKVNAGDTRAGKVDRGNSVKRVLFKKGATPENVHGMYSHRSMDGTNAA